MKFFITILSLLYFAEARAQKVDSIYFHLYTDSLKLGVYNYISVDGKLSDGSFYPLMNTEVTFSSSAGKWDGNSIILDSSYRKDSVVINVALKSNPEVVKTITIYIKRKEETEKLRTEQEVLESIRNNGRKRNKP